MWIDPQEPGVFLGQCAEFCGTQHALMLLRVVVHPRTEWDRWVSASDGRRPRIHRWRTAGTCSSRRRA